MKKIKTINVEGFGADIMASRIEIILAIGDFIKTIDNHE
jgi:hypothetical protein